MPDWFLFAVVAIVLVAVFVYVRFGKSAATIFVAAAALLLAFLKGRQGAKEEAKIDVLKEDLRNEQRRTSAEARADAAADRVRIVVDNDPSRLREHDPFERR